MPPVEPELPPEKERAKRSWQPSVPSLPFIVTLFPIFAR
jgi:hypothetical protein